ncbi:CD302 antigen [Eleutherodactylus coqui]|uniref:CD302 antigen n=1 Tax=Eleutherodactylus coqui TaxID=57060 RepID=UPI00346214B4
MRGPLSYLVAAVRTWLLIYLCSAVIVSGQSVVPREGSVCSPPLWVQFNSSCYIFVDVTQKDSLGTEHARELCKDIGADIISISSKEENSFLVKMFQLEWKDTTEILLGMFYDSDDNSLKWYDKSEVTFLNWGRVNLADNDLNTCVKMNTKSGLWDVTDCDSFMESSVLCKYASKETRTFGNKGTMIALITIFTIIILVLPPIVIFHKRKNWSVGLHRAETLPYSDDAALADTMEREDYA